MLRDTAPALAFIGAGIKLAAAGAEVNPGRIVTVGWMKGRSRLFAVSGPDQQTTAAATIAFNDKCDVVVATVTAEADLPRGTRQALQFLNSDPVLRWAQAELGSNGS